MKKALLFLIPAIAVGVTVFSLLRVKKHMPQPVETIIVDGEDEDHFIKKQAWFDEMHKAAEGVNWKQMDIESRSKRLSEIGGAKAVNGEWSEVGSNNLAGRTHLADYDYETGEVYLLTSGGNIWKGTAGEDDWQCFNDHFQITGAHFFRRLNLDGGERWVVATADWNIQGFLFSDDLGANWNYTTGLENAANWGTLKRAVMIMQNDQPVFYVLTKEWDYTNWNAISCIYKSTDLGESFTQLFEFDAPTYGDVNEFDMWADYELKNTVYLVENENFYTLDDQDQMVLLGNLPEVTGNTRLAGFDDGNTKKFYVSKTNNNYTNFYGSDDGGITWSARGGVNEGPFQANSFAASVVNPDILYFGGVSGFRSENGGTTWTKVNNWWDYYGNEETKLHADLPGLCPFEVDGEEILFINTDGGTYISNDNMQTVQNISLSNLRISQYYSTYTYSEDHNVIYAGAQDQGYQRTVAAQTGDDVYDFDQLISGDYGHLVSGDGGASIWCVYPGFAMYYPDAVNGTYNRTWDFVGSGHFWMPQLMEDPYDPEGCYYAGGSTTTGSHIFYLSYTGYSINYTEQDFDFSEGGDAKISAMTYSKANPIKRYVLTSEGAFFSSHDAGETWSKSQGFNGPGCHYFYGASIVVSDDNPNTIYIGGSGYSSCPVFVSYDGGDTFEDFDTGLPGTLVFDMVLNDDETILFAATEIGAFACDLTTGEWTDLFEAGVPDQAFWSVEWVDTFARFATYGRGIWDFTPSNAPVAGFLADQTTGCEGMQVQFQDISSNNPETWLWEFEGGNPSSSTDQTPPPVLYENAGLFDVSLTVTSPAGTNTKVMEEHIEVIPVPSVPEQVNGPDLVKLTDLTTPVAIETIEYATSYEWNLTPEEAGQIESDEITAVIVWTEGFLGDVEISVAAIGMCGQSEFSEPKIITRYHNVGLDEFKDEIVIYPNPAKSNINYKLPDQAKNICIINGIGERVAVLTENEGIINVSDYKPGVYFLICNIKNQKISQRLMVTD